MIAAQHRSAQFDKRYPKTAFIWRSLSSDEKRMADDVRTGWVTTLVVRDWDDLYLAKTGNQATALPATERNRRQRAEARAGQELMF